MHRSFIVNQTNLQSGGSNLPRPEYPRPQFVRADWVNLNGPWTYTFDFGQSGYQRAFESSQGFEDTITVPFCPESSLSGVGYTDFIPAMWYQRTITLPAGWQGKRVLVHFGGVDYQCEAFIDGKSVGRHWGGTVSFTFDITHFVKAGSSHSLVLAVQDDTRSGNQPGGKQSHKFNSFSCLYTRTTGIWQTVWLEAVDPHGLKSIYSVPNLDSSTFTITPTFYATRRGLQLVATLSAGGQIVSQVTQAANQGEACVLPVSNPRPWSPEDPFLYDLDLQVVDENGAVLDQVSSYAGLRKVHVEGNQVYLNNKPYYLRLVLDQGFYPDGIWTAPSDAALKRDIELAMEAGFNGARLHQKVFEERFHYWADQLGYLTWGESSSWGMDCKDITSARNFLSEWHEIVVRDRNHPSIIAWTPFNETWDTGDRRQHNRLHIDAYELTRSLDPTRPVNDASGYAHARTDLWTVHTYVQPPAELAEQLAMTDEGPFRNFPDREPDYEGQPYIVDEFGGIKWIPEDRRPFASDSWGYGEGPRSLDEFYARLEGQVCVLSNLAHISGYCYTQLTDVEQEQNGIYNYDRTPKFDMDRISTIFKLVEQRK
jgi:beta-galactosidase/beta-glucuronidase